MAHGCKPRLRLSRRAATFAETRKRYWEDITGLDDDEADELEYRLEREGHLVVNHGNGALSVYRR